MRDDESQHPDEGRPEEESSPMTGAYAGWGSDEDVVAPAEGAPDTGSLDMDDESQPSEPDVPPEWREAAAQEGFLPPEEEEGEAKASGQSSPPPEPRPEPQPASASDTGSPRGAPEANEPERDGGAADRWLPHSHLLDRDGLPVERLRVAYRSFLGLWAIFALGALCAFWPTWPFTVDALSGYGVLDALSEEHAALLTTGLFGLGGIAMAYALTVIGYRRLASRFHLMPQAISEERGLIARRVSRVELSHIRTVDVRQSILDRVLGIGSIHFASAGTGANDVNWHGVLAPVATQRAVLARLRQIEGGD